MVNVVFQFVIKIAVDRKLVAGKTVGVDSATLEANAAMKTIVRRIRVRTGSSTSRAIREDGTIEPDCESTDEEVRR